MYLINSLILNQNVPLVLYKPFVPPILRFSRGHWLVWPLQLILEDLRVTPTINIGQHRYILVNVYVTNGNLSSTKSLYHKSLPTNLRIKPVIVRRVSHRNISRQPIFVTICQRFHCCIFYTMKECNCRCRHWNFFN